MTQAMRMLLAEGLITREQLDRALTQKATRGGTASFHLVEAGAVDADALVRFLARRFPVPRCPRQRLELAPPPALAALPAALARSLRLVPVALRDRVLTVAIGDPTETHALKEAARASGFRVEIALASEADLSFWLEHHYRSGKAPAAPDDDVPLPLTRRITRKMAVVSGDDARPEPEATGATIAEALDAIPLVNRTSGPPVPPARPDYDSWSTGPAAPPPPVAATSPDAAAAPSAEAPRALSEGEIIAAIGRAADRDAVVALAFDYLRRCAARAAFFVVKRAEIRGFDIVDDLSHRDAARAFWIPLAAPSTLRRVAEERRVFVGPLDRTSADAVLSAALGGRPERVLVIPIALHGKTVGLLMADGFSAAIPPLARVERLSSSVADALSRLIAREKSP